MQLSELRLGGFEVGSELLLFSFPNNSILLLAVPVPVPFFAAPLALARGVSSFFLLLPFLLCGERSISLGRVAPIGGKAGASLSSTGALQVVASAQRRANGAHHFVIVIACIVDEKLS